MLSQIARTKRSQPLHSLTYRLCSRKVLHSRCFTSLGFIAGLSYLAALASQFWSFCTCAVFRFLFFSDFWSPRPLLTSPGFDPAMSNTLLSFSSIDVYGHLFSWHTCVLTFTFFVAGAGLVGARNALVSGKEHHTFGFPPQDMDQRRIANVINIVCTLFIY